jgi:MFS superfamily sulfate permease-like transporter
MQSSTSMFSYPRQDAVAGVVVFLVALPLCLGIAVACGVPPISGLVAGIVGGLVVPFISRSPLSVTGPAAGLTTIVLTESVALGGLNRLLAALIAAGVIQFAFGVVRGGRFSALVPSAVVKGMLAAIGITIVLKELPVAFGVMGGWPTVAAQFSTGAILIAIVALVILFGWQRTAMARMPLLSPALIVVVVASALAFTFAYVPALALSPSNYVNVPLGSLRELRAALPRPDLAALALPATWRVGATIAVVASLETLLSLQAIDRLDPLRRKSPPDRELLAQGFANVVSGLLGGLPVTAVIVRGSTNLAAGARERFSALVHGVLLLVTVLFLGRLINHIPLAALAAVLIQVGVRLCTPALFRAQYKLGLDQFVPFALTIVAIIATDLMEGVIIGMILGVLFVLRQNTKNAIVRNVDHDGTIVVKFRRDGTFISKPALITILGAIANDQRVVVDATDEFVDHDMKEVLVGFTQEAPARGIAVTMRGVDLSTMQPSGGH